MHQKLLFNKMSKKENIDISTEEKIKEAAKKIFHEKGVNLALLNYYFRSKEKLFDIIMLATLTKFAVTIKDILNDEKSSFDDKIELIVSNYIDFLSKEQNVPLFMLSEIRNNPKKTLNKIPFKKLVQNSVFIKQYNEAVEEGKITETNINQFVINLISLIIFPFIGQPILQEIHGLSDEQYYNLLQQRKKMIPIWVKTMMMRT